MEKVDIKRVQARLLQMAVHITGILEANWIPYLIAFGTLLGAVRHGGFIPWDDDFDLFLFDDSYDRAIAALRKQLPGDMFVEDEQSEPRYFHGWAHVKDLHTECECCQFPQDNLYAHHGLSVGLYRIKGMSSTNLLPYRLEQLDKYLKRKLDKRIINQGEFSVEYERLKIRIEQEEAQNPFPNTSIYAMAVKERYMLESDIFPLRKYRFESVEFYGPHNFDGILRHFYGDYMELPKEQDRIPHYSKVVFEKADVTVMNFKDSGLEISALKNFIAENDHLFPDPFSSHVDISAYVDKLHGLGEILVAVGPNGICGAAAAYMNDAVLKTFFLQLFVVDKAHQGQGIGKSLLLSLFDLGKRHGMVRGRCTVDKGNVRAEALYRKTGWFDSDAVHENPAKKYLDVVLG